MWPMYIYVVKNAYLVSVHNSTVLIQYLCGRCFTNTTKSTIRNVLLSCFYLQEKLKQSPGSVMVDIGTNPL
jgi:hypothetical protein